MSSSRPSMMTSTTQWPWCSDNGRVNVWFARHLGLRYKTFYGSLINLCNHAWEVERDLVTTPNDVNEQRVLDLIRIYPITADALIEVLEWYAGFVKNKDYKTRGLVDLDSPTDSDIMEAKDQLYKKIFTEEERRQHAAAREASTGQPQPPILSRKEKEADKIARRKARREARTNAGEEAEEEDEEEDEDVEMH